VSRYDYIEVSRSLFRGLSEEELREIDGLEFQTKDLEREYLVYYLTESGNMFFRDYHYELVDTPHKPIFKQSLKRIEHGIESCNFSGVIEFYGKPYQHFYTFQAKITNGKLKYIRLLSKT
jgi:hypothetical protein